MTANDVGSLISERCRSIGGGSWGDFDNDGDADLWYGGNAGSALHVNDGRGRFTRAEVALPTGVSGTAWPAWNDFDNDGFLDLSGAELIGGTYVFKLYRNLAGTDFADVTSSAALGPFSVNPALFSWGDYDNDGFLDLFVPHRSTADFLYTNNLPALGNPNHWLKVKLEGRVSNRTAIGAKVRAQATIHGRTFSQMREISGNAYFGGGGQLLIAHFGLGDATNVTTLTIEWPSGIVQEFSDVAADQYLKIEEHEDYAETNPVPALTLVGTSTNGLALTIQEPTAGAHYALEGSTDLQNWAMLLSRKSVGGTQDYIDTKATNGTARFYRVIVP